MIEIPDESRIREIAREEAQRPRYLTQRNVEEILGIPRRTYLRAAKAGAFPFAKEARLVVALYDDVARWLDLRLRARGGTPANDADAETIALRSVGARRVEGGR